MINPLSPINPIDHSDKSYQAQKINRDSIEFSEFAIKLSEYMQELRRLEDVRADLVKRMSALSCIPLRKEIPSELAYLFHRRN